MNFFKKLSNIISDFLHEDSKVVVTENYTEYEEPTYEKENAEEESVDNDVDIESENITNIRNWAIDRIKNLDNDSAISIAAEFYEWIELPEDVEEIEYMCIQSQEWTDEEEIDVDWIDNY